MQPQQTQQPQQQQQNFQLENHSRVHQQNPQPISNKSGQYGQYQSQAPFAMNSDNAHYDRTPTRSEKSFKSTSNKSYHNEPQEEVSQHQLELIIQRVQKRLSSRGAKGFLGLIRMFKILDVDNDG